jgi:hypothetical protein
MLCSFVLFEERRLRKDLIENTEAHIRKRLLEKYNVYYAHWKDFYCLTAFLAMAGFFVALADWEDTFDHRGPDGHLTKKRQLVFSPLIKYLTVMAITSLFIEHYFASKWQDYRNPVSFYKQTTVKLVEQDMLGRHLITENYRLEQVRIFKVLFSPQFILEAALLCCEPDLVRSLLGGDRIIDMDTINWND